jgi:hypothetical protein
MARGGRRAGAGRPARHDISQEMFLEASCEALSRAKATGRTREGIIADVREIALARYGTEFSMDSINRLWKRHRLDLKAVADHDYVPGPNIRLPKPSK